MVKITFYLKNCQMATLETSQSQIENLHKMIDKCTDGFYEIYGGNKKALIKASEVTMIEIQEKSNV